MPRRVVIFGPESTGKTTLALRLARHFGEPCSEEYVRRFWDQREGVIGASDLDAVARGQMLAEDEAEARAREFVFWDTDMLTCTIWDDLLFPGACPDWVRQEAERRSRGVSLYLLCETDVPFEPDPQRCFPDPAARERCMRLWRWTLESRSLPVVTISGGWDERFETARSAVQRLRGG